MTGRTYRGENNQKNVRESFLKILLIILLIKWRRITVNRWSLLLSSNSYAQHSETPMSKEEKLTYWIFLYKVVDCLKELNHFIEKKINFVQGFSSQTSLNPQMNDHSLADGLLSATNLLATVGFGHAVTERNVSTKEKNTETIFPATVNLNHSVSENGMGRSQFSTRSSSPIRKQHKRTSSSPLEHLSMPKSNSIYFHIQDRPNSTPSKHETLPPLSIAPPPPPTSSSRQNPFSLSDSHLLNCRVDTSNQFGNKSMSSSRPRFHYSSSTSGLWNYDERARHSSLLDIDTEEQKEHRARVLPAEINETVPIPHHSLEKEFLG